MDHYVPIQYLSWTYHSSISSVKVYRYITNLNKVFGLWCHWISKHNPFWFQYILKLTIFLKNQLPNKINYTQQFIAALVIKEDTVQGHQKEDKALVCIRPTWRSHVVTKKPITPGLAVTCLEAVEPGKVWGIYTQGCLPLPRKVNGKGSTRHSLEVKGWRTTVTSGNKNSDWMERKICSKWHKKTLFTKQSKQWRRLHREAVKPSSHGILETQTDVAPSNLI